MLGNVGFSVFRIMVGIAFLVGGYDKSFRLIASGFQDQWLGEWFIDLIHGGVTSPHVAFFMPKAALIAFGYLIPFWELAVGVCIVFGIYRMFGAVMGMALVAMFLVGGEATHAYEYPQMIIEIIQMYVFGFGFFFLYRELRKDPVDPWAIDTLRLRTGTSRR